MVRTLRCRWRGIADFDRWADLGNHDPQWDRRSEQIADLIPARSRIVEFGAGRRQLERYLPPGCVYFPSDLVSRGPGTIVCDLNARPLPDLSALNLDVAVFGGVLEYLVDLYGVAAWLARQAPLCIASYECAFSRPGSLARMVESLARVRAGWVNTYNEDQLREIFAAFVLCDTRAFEERDGDGRIFVFRRRDAVGTR